jgi:hypothetical protein
MTIALLKWISKEQEMKGISSAANSIVFTVVLFISMTAPLLAQAQDILGRKTPPLQSLAGFDREETLIQAGATSITPDESLALIGAHAGDNLVLPSLDAYFGFESEPLKYQRVEMFAPGARVIVVGEDGVVEWQRDARQFFLATNSTTGVALAVDVSSGQISGFAVKGSSKMQLDGQLDVGIELQVVKDSAESSNSCGTDQDDQHPASISFLKNPIPESINGVASGGGVLYQAVIAIETDNEWMAGKGNNPATAMTWITDTFLAMNVFYERDVNTRLLIGDVILRTTSDPYTVAGNRSNQLDEFAQYWRLNMDSTDRDFAAMLSGRDISSGSFSGIAWVNNYCQKGFVWNNRTVGSYSFNAVGSGRSAAGVALYIGHEIGHNMGSPHTHCYNPSVDQCYSGESSCYSGSTSCPAGGKGTVMSYCHVSGSSGAGCGTSNSEFHPTVQTLLESRLADNSPSCIAPYTEQQPPTSDVIFSEGFEIY